MAHGIHSPQIIAEARRYGITPLQAYRRAQQRETLARETRQAASKREGQRHDK